ncbi:MAG: baseplate protein, partial [Candidatus Heimdallarchaeota archaeon]
MPLPKISTPTYELELPSTGKTIKFRPFLVKEEKLLVLALESDDSKEITNAIKAVLKDCIQTRGVKVDTLPTFDIEYLFLNIRGKSVGETVDVILTCPDDGETRVDVTIPLCDIKVQKDPNHTNIIQLDEQFSMKMRYPSLSEFIQDNFVDSGVEQI